MTGSEKPLGYILGAGHVGPARHQDIEGSYLRLAAEAVGRAVDDAGIDHAAIDGIVINSGGDAGPDYDQLADHLGLEVRANLQSWAHGRFTASTIYNATCLIRDGYADVVACVYARRLDRDVVGGPAWKSWKEELRAGGGPHGENPLVGLTAPIGSAALAMRAYCLEFGIDPGEVFSVVEASRSWSQFYPGAIRPGQVTRAAYEEQGYIVDPLRRWDCTPRTEGAVCVLVGRRSAAADTNRAVAVAGFSPIPKHKDELYHWWPSQRPGSDGVFSSSGITRSDVNAFYTYDAFSPQVWFGLERAGYAEPGQAPAFIAEHGIGRDGSFPTNTHGGSLSAGQLAGWLHIVEAVTQIRGEAGPRQLATADVAHFAPSLGDSLLLARS